MTTEAGVGMGRPSGWWRGKSTPAKVETYTRWSFHFFALLEALSIGLPVFGILPPVRSWAVFLLVCGHAAFCSVTASRTLDWTRGTRERPRRMLSALIVATFATAVAGSVLSGSPWAPASDSAFTVASSLLVGVTAFGTGTVALGTRDRRRMSHLVLGASAGTGVLALPLGFPAPAALVTAFIVLLATGFLTFTAAFSVWLLTAVYELDEARETRARLAVAEERLRFGRDLHDVMGRNLAVIALKSELAVQLARRGRPEAVDQMTEVQRIARESQREVRAVVRGYREADLAGELAGAQGVLTAAGIECSITGTAAELPPRVQSALGWVVREATTNVLRHGNARMVALSLRVTPDRVTLTVENDGAPRETDPDSGPDGGPRPGRGSGLPGLRERLGEVDGVLRAGARDGVFRLTADVPLSPSPDGSPDTPGPAPGNSGGRAPAGAGSPDPTKDRGPGPGNGPASAGRPGPASAGRLGPPDIGESHRETVPGNGPDSAGRPRPASTGRPSPADIGESHRDAVSGNGGDPAPGSGEESPGGSPPSVPHQVREATP